MWEISEAYAGATLNRKPSLRINQDFEPCILMANRRAAFKETPRNYCSSEVKLSLHWTWYIKDVKRSILLRSSIWKLPKTMNQKTFKSKVFLVKHGLQLFGSTGNLYEPKFQPVPAIWCTAVFHASISSSVLDRPTADRLQHTHITNNNCGLSLSRKFHILRLP